MIIIWKISLLIILSLTLFASTRIILEEFVKFPKNKYLDIITSQKWCYTLFLIIPAQIGEYARAETSPLPWEAFAQAYQRHGFYDGFLVILTVLIANLWLFWIPASIWIEKHSIDDRTKRIMARIINFLLGLILTQVANPFYQLLT